jgi:group I intron endonuclease
MSFGLIYKVSCLVSRKSYIGQTTKTAESRWNEHLLVTSKKKYALSNAIRKHGRAAFSVEVLEFCDTPEDLDDAERFWVDWYQTIAPLGYNLTSGGRTYRLSEASRRKMSELANRRFSSAEERAKISIGKLNSGYRHSDAAKAKMAASSKGRPAHNKGARMSEEQRAKLRAAWVRRKERAAA